MFGFFDGFGLGGSLVGFLDGDAAELPARRLSDEAGIHKGGHAAADRVQVDGVALAGQFPAYRFDGPLVSDRHGGIDLLRD